MTDKKTSPRSQSLTYSAPDILRRQWTTEIDTTTRRLKIERRWWGLKPKIVVDCSLDECAAVGTIEYRSEEATSYGIYVELKTGRRHGIPQTNHSYAAASKIAQELSAETGLQRRDIVYA